MPTPPPATAPDEPSSRPSSRPPSRPPSAPPLVVALVGPTASGKSEVALEVALRLGGEVVNTDAMAVYRGMDIGTAKPSVGERRGVPHHLFDLLEVTEPASVAEFQGWARAAIGDLHARGRVPVLVGGSALYTRAILDRFEFPGTDPVVRARLESDLESEGVAALHARLADVDPAAAAGIEPGNGRRVVRALEVVEITGRPFSATLPTMTYHYPGAVQVGLRMPRAVRDERIAARVERMFADGLVAEVEALLERGLAEGRTAALAIGYREVAAYLRGAAGLEQTKADIVRATRRFSRRQDAWFDKDPRVVWVEWDDEARVEKAVAAVLSAGDAR